MTMLDPVECVKAALEKHFDNEHSTVLLDSERQEIAEVAAAALASPASPAPDAVLREALERLLANRHHHVASTDGDNCYSCNRDLRDPIHYRAGEGPNSDREFARQALAPPASTAEGEGE